MDKLVALRVLSGQRLNLNSERYVFPDQMWKSIRGIRYNQVQSVIFEYPFDLLYHLGSIDIRVLRTKKSINSRFIQNHIELLIRIGHGSHIHHLVDHPILLFLLLNAIHLSDHLFGNVIIMDLVVARIVEVVLYLSVPTPNIKYFYAFIFAIVFFYDGF